MDVALPRQSSGDILLGEIEIPFVEVRWQPAVFFKSQVFEMRKIRCSASLETRLSCAGRAPKNALDFSRD